MATTTTTPEPMTAVERYVEGLCGIKLSPQVITDVHVGLLPTMTNWGPLNDAPTIVDLITDETLVDDVDFLWSELGQLTLLKKRLPTRWQITYTPGYEEVPEALQEVLDGLAAWLLAVAATGGMESEKLGDYSYKVAAAALSSKANPYAELMVPWKRRY